MKALSVILIAHNEEQAIGRMLEGLLANYDQEILEIIVVDDASRDRTAEIVETWSKRNAKVILVKRRPPCGVGRALKAGFNRINPKAECVLSNTRHGRAMRGCLRHSCVPGSEVVAIHLSVSDSRQFLLVFTQPDSDGCARTQFDLEQRRTRLSGYLFRALSYRGIFLPSARTFEAGSSHARR